MRKKHKRKRPIPLELLATRKGNREAEFETKGPGFHAREKVRESKKVYKRNKKNNEDVLSEQD